MSMKHDHRKTLQCVPRNTDMFVDLPPTLHRTVNLSANFFVCFCSRTGLKTALVEADDFASGTSSRSTKLIHGGVRYLQKAILGVS